MIRERGDHFRISFARRVPVAARPVDARLAWTIRCSITRRFCRSRASRSAGCSAMPGAAILRLQFGAIFVSDRHGQIAGTLPMSLIKTENSGNGRAPDIIVSFSYDENVAVAGKSGVSYASSVNRRGDHGSFSPTDTHISLMASGPDFKSGLHDTLPTANVDIAPTVARILEFSMPAVQGRVLEEALQGGPPCRRIRRIAHRRRRGPIDRGNEGRPTTAAASADSLCGSSRRPRPSTRGGLKALHLLQRSGEKCPTNSW